MDSQFVVRTNQTRIVSPYLHTNRIRENKKKRKERDCHGAGKQDQHETHHACLMKSQSEIDGPSYRSAIYHYYYYFSSSNPKKKKN
mmetsp:Transcript_6308/g.13032  ORF Transcript_6308/g.13032 Transcript_6308/m.13032 type:complete len:86 (+) Transcript_6308:558-815(+)